MNETIQVHEGLKLKEIYLVKQLKCSLHMLQYTKCYEKQRYISFCLKLGAEGKKGFREIIAEINNSNGEKDFSKKIGQIGVSDKRNNIAKAQRT